jgi:hypothetical protein
LCAGHVKLEEQTSQHDLTSNLVSKIPAGSIRQTGLESAPVIPSIHQARCWVHSGATIRTRNQRMVRRRRLVPPTHSLRRAVVVVSNNWICRETPQELYIQSTLESRPPSHGAGWMYMHGSDGDEQLSRFGHGSDEILSHAIRSRLLDRPYGLERGFYRAQEGLRDCPGRCQGLMD